MLGRVHPSAGTWSEPLKIFEGYRGGDLNFSPLILANGSLIALWRKWSKGGDYRSNLGSRIFLATAANWRDTSTYVMHKYG